MADNCEYCGAKPGKGGKVTMHKTGCPTKKYQGAEESPAEVKADKPFAHEVIRTPQDLPQVGEWYVLGFLMPIGYDSVKDCRTYGIEITLAPVSTITPHGRDFRVTFDMEQTKVFKADLAGHLLTRADKVVAALRQMADLVERGAE